MEAGKFVIFRKDQPDQGLEVLDRAKAESVVAILNQNPSQEEKPVVTARSEFKGNNMLQIFKNDGDRKAVVQFGLSKAKLVTSAESQIALDQFINLVAGDELVLGPDSTYPWKVNQEQAQALQDAMPEILTFIQEEEAKK